MERIWCLKMEDDAHRPDELNSHLRVMKTDLKARYRLSVLLRAQRNDRMTSILKRWIENGAPDKRDLKEDSCLKRDLKEDRTLRNIICRKREGYI